MNVHIIRFNEDFEQRTGRFGTSWKVVKKVLEIVEV